MSPSSLYSNFWLAQSLLHTQNQAIASLSEALESRNEDVNALIAELRRLQGVQKSIEKDTEIASSTIRTLERDLAEEVSNHESDNVRLSQLLKEKEDRIAQAIAASDKSRTAIEDLEIELAKNREEMLRIEASSSEKAGALDRVRSELAELKSQYQSKVNALEDLSEEVAKLESDNARLSQVSSKLLERGLDLAKRCSFALHPVAAIEREGRPYHAAKHCFGWKQNRHWRS